jgi:hypothetical protein
MDSSPNFERLLVFLEKLPAIDLRAGQKSIGRGSFENGNWWVKFTLDTTHHWLGGMFRSLAMF